MVGVVTKYCSRQILCHTLEIIPDYLGNFVESENLKKVQHLQEFSSQMCTLEGPVHMKEIIISELLVIRKTRNNCEVWKNGDKGDFEAGLVIHQIKVRPLACLIIMGQFCGKLWAKIRS